MELKEFTLKEFLEQATTQDTIDFIKFLAEKNLISGHAFVGFTDYQRNENKRIKDIGNATRKIVDSSDQINVIANMIKLMMSVNNFLNTFDEYDFSDDDLNAWVSEYVGKDYAK